MRTYQESNDNSPRSGEVGRGSGRMEALQLLSRPFDECYTSSRAVGGSDAVAAREGLSSSICVSTCRSPKLAPICRILFAALISLSLGSFTEAKCPIVLSDVTEQTGIDFIHTDGSSGQRYIVETVCCGLALLDYDGDGDMDIYFLNGATLKGSRSGISPTNRLYRNDGNWRFTDVTSEAGVGDPGYGLGVCAGDYDNDGDQDLYVSNFGENVLYRNNGNGTFRDVTAQARVENGNKLGAGACFLDADGDGDLDLYVSNYVTFNYENHKTTHMNGFPTYVGPLNYSPAPDSLYRNNGDGTFTDISESSRIAQHLGNGMGVICADYDDDGDTDIFVGNDGLANFLFENDGQGVFREVGLLTGLAFDYQGVGQGSMGVECGDVNNDGRFDFFVTTYHRQLSTLYLNIGDTLFDDVTRRTGAGTGTFAQVTWGTGLVDFDNDGDRDIFMACGHLLDNVDQFDDTTSYLAQNILLMNSDGKFVDVSRECGDGLSTKLSSRGAAFDDLDNDGDVDVVILNSRREPTILRNDSPRTNHWLQVQLRGLKSNRGGIGARVKVTAGDLVLIDEVHSGRSYQSDFGKRLQFGLGTRDKIDHVEVHWIGGGREVFERIEADQMITLIEDQGMAPASTSR